MKALFYIIGLLILAALVVVGMTGIVTAAFTAYGFKAACGAYLVGALARHAVGAIVGGAK
jgi:hypothetical protein